MGRNGSGKSTLANALMGHPKYLVTSGRVRLDGEDVLALKPDERAKRGHVSGLSEPDHHSRASVRATSCARRSKPCAAPRPSMRWPSARSWPSACRTLQMDPSFATRALNEGFSGGEKKRAEMLQLAMLKPRMAILDEPDSGLDIDAVRIVSDGINLVHEQQPDMGILLITHYQRILNYVRPDRVHVMANGRIVESGGAELVQQLESEGYDPILRRLGIEEAEEATSHGR